MATFGSGAQIGTTKSTKQDHLRTTPPDLKPARNVSSVVAVGLLIPGIASRRIAFGFDRRSVATLWVFVWCEICQASDAA